MAIKVTCQGCSSSFNAPDGAAGKTGKCPKCGAAISIPGAPIQAARPTPPPTAPRPPVAAPAPPPPVVAQPFYEAPRPTPQVAATIEHTHKTKGSFGTMFKGTMGCLLAVGIVTMIGCIGVGFVLFSGAAVTVAAIDEGMKEVNRHTDEQLAKIKAWEAMVADVTAKVTTTDGRIEQSDNQFDTAKNVLVFTVVNGSDKPIADIKFHARIAEPGRTVALAEDDIYLGISGGVEPGESKEVRVKPNPFDGNLGTVAVPEGAELTVTLTEVEWPGREERPSIY